MILQGKNEKECKVKILDIHQALLYHNQTMEDFVRQSLLFDFYGDLLTEHQKSVYGAYIQDNLSLSEIAEDSGISRQGVHDMVRRCRHILEDYEEKLGLVERFVEIKEKVIQIKDTDNITRIKTLADEIMELL